MYKFNRQKRLESQKKKKFWCDKCDANKVGEWEKCKVCGHRTGIKRYKK